MSIVGNAEHETTYCFVGLDGRTYFVHVHRSSRIVSAYTNREERIRGMTWVYKDTVSVQTAIDNCPRDVYKDGFVPMPWPEKVE
jgi:hypothetical protein